MPLPDWMIERDVKIEPFAPAEHRPGKVSYGVTSYGYDARIGYKFKVFKPYPCSTIDPKAFDQRMLEDVDLSCGEDGHDYVDTFDDMRTPKTPRCSKCGCMRSYIQAFPPESRRCSQAPDEHIVIPPHSFALGETLEYFEIPRDVLCVVLGKSTYARCGLIVNVTPLEPEWKGKVTVELSNTTPLPMKVYAGEGIMQCVFLRSDGTREAEANAHLLHVINRLKWAWSEGDEQEIEKIVAAGACKQSYVDKKGKYQNQGGLTVPIVK